MRTIDRRQFLTAAGAAASAALGQAAPGRIRTGILCIQHSHLSEKLKVMHNNPDYDVVAVCEPDEATRRAKGGNPMFEHLRWVSMDDMLGDKSLDLIVFEGEVKDAVLEHGIAALRPPGRFVGLADRNHV